MRGGGDVEDQASSPAIPEEHGHEQNDMRPCKLAPKIITPTFDRPRWFPTSQDSIALLSSQQTAKRREKIPGIGQTVATSIESEAREDEKNAKKNPEINQRSRGSYDRELIPPLPLPGRRHNLAGGILVCLDRAGNRTS